MEQQVISKINQTINNIYNIIKYNFHINNKNYIKFYHTVTSAGVCSSFLLLLLTLSILIPINLKGEKTIAASGDTSTTSLTLSTTSGSAELDLLVTSDSGTFASSTTPLTFSASTNNYTGYTLSIKSATSSTNLTNSTKDANNNTVTAAFTSLSSTNATTKNGVTADTFNSSAYNNQWGFKPSYYNSTANSDKFYPSPDSTGVTLNRTNCANGSSNGTYTCSNATDSYTIEIGARATYVQVAGTYTNKYILSAVGNYPEYKITYNDASGESTDLPTTQEISSLDNETAKQTSISFSATEPTRDGYKFIGWCSVDNSADPTTCSGTTYDPGDTYALDLLSSNNMPLYAIWQLNKVYMQDLTSTTISALLPSVGTTTTVYDNRDDQAYIIGKLADNKYWMLQNLAFDAVSHKDDITISNTHVDAASLNAFKNGGGTSSDRYAMTGLASSWTTSDSYSEPRIAVSGNCSDTTYCVNNPSGQWASTDTVKYAMGQSGANTVGAYYNYCAATAGNYCYGSDTSQGTSSGDASYDICPYNWRLPTGGSSGEFQALYTAYSSNAANYVNALRLPLSGTFSSGKAHDQEAYSGYFWSSTRSNDYNMYYLGVSVSSIYPENDINRRYGRSVRCVFDGYTISDVTYMQDITPAVVTATVEGSVATLLDRRDTSDYTVKKINGQLWMTQNLRITGTIPSTDSNFDYINSFNVSQYNLTNKTYCNAGTSSNPSGYTYACSRLGTSITGAWYNFAAASAGTVAGYSSNVDATQDICPANWHLPTGPSTTAGTDYNKLIGNTNYGWQTTTGLTEFGAVVGGYYSAGTLTAIKTDGHWWSAAASDDNSRYRLYYDGTSGQFLADGSAGYARFYGLFIRCVAKS